MKPIIRLLLLAFILSSCAKTKWSDVTVNAKYNMQLPGYLEAADFNKDASLQIQNTEKEIYLMMIDEDKAQFAKYGLEYDLPTYFKVAASKYDTAGTTVPHAFLLGKDSVLAADFKGMVNGNEVLFKVITLESKTSFYKLIIWMMYRDKDAYAPDIDRIIHSFKEIGKKD
jgi:hypothetical protein